MSIQCWRRPFQRGRSQHMLPLGSVNRRAALRSTHPARGASILMESLILAQDERWRRASYMQVEREPGLALGRAANGCVTREQPAPKTGTSRGNLV